MGCLGLGMHGISVYALENQLPFPKVVASPEFASVDDDDRSLIT